MSEYQYLDLLSDCLHFGTHREGRNGGTYGLFGRQIRFNLREGFPLLTSKKIFTKSVFGELLWFLTGSTNVKDLHKMGIHIWDQWAGEDGDLGPVYGAQWRGYRGVCHKCEGTGREFDGDDVVDDCYECGGYGNEMLDQLQLVIDGIKDDPNGRRHVVSAWNPVEIQHMALPPCHCLFQFFVADGKLSCQLYQRSADIFIGVPFNIASYALLTHLVARECGLEVGDFVHTFGDVHLYANHVEQAQEQLKRPTKPFPKLVIEGDKGIFGIGLEDIKVEGYDPAPHIPAPVST